MFAAAGLAGALATPAAGESPAVGLLATASAQGARMTYSIPGFLVVETIFDAGGPVAQSVVDGAGGRSFASLPYPGETALIAPALPNLVGAPPLPVSYPFFAAAQYPGTPQAQVADPTGSYHLEARAGDRSATSEALTRLGSEEASAGTSRAISGIEQGADGTVTARAEALTQGLSLGMLRIGSVQSHSTTVAAPGQPSQTTQELLVEGARLGDTPLSIGPEGAQGPAGSVNEVLSQSGLSVRVLSGSEVNGGRTGDILEVRSIHSVPGANQGVVVWRFGGVTTSVVAGSPEGDVVLPETPPAAEAAAPAPSPGSPAPGAIPSALPTDDLPNGESTEVVASFPAQFTAGGSFSSLPDVSGPPTDLGAVSSPTGVETTGPATTGVVSTPPTAGWAQPIAAVSGSLRPAYLVLLVGTAVGLAATAAWRRRAS